MKITFIGLSRDFPFSSFPSFHGREEKSGKRDLHNAKSSSFATFN